MDTPFQKWRHYLVSLAILFGLLALIVLAVDCVNDWELRKARENAPARAPNQ